MGDEDKEAILARRKQFIALAIAGGATVGAAVVGAGAYAVMAPCLSPVVTAPPDTGTDAPPPSIGMDAGVMAEATERSAEVIPPVAPIEPPPVEAESEGRTVPRTVLRPEAMPRPCLSVVAPRPSESAETPPARLPRVTE